MAVQSTSVWRVRVGGVSTNGAGYDPGIAGAATDYTDQDSPQLSITDGATSGAGSTTLTSAAAGFTSAMIGNCIRIASGTNFQTGYYFITAFGSSSSVTVDRTPTSGAAGSGGTGALGGATHNVLTFANGGSGTQPAITTPLVAGNTIYVRGAGLSDPSSTDYTMTSGYWTFPAGNLTSGKIRLIGYNGKPLFLTQALMIYQTNYWHAENLAFKPNSTTNQNNGGIIFGGGLECSIKNCIFDQAGLDLAMVTANAIIGTLFKNTGVTTAGTKGVFDFSNSGANYNILMMGNTCKDVRGSFIIQTSSMMSCIINNIIYNTHSTTTGAIQIGVALQGYCNHVIGNTIYNVAGDGIVVDNTTDADGITGMTITNNIISTCAAFGIRITSGTAALNDKSMRIQPDYNNIYNCTSGAYSGISAGAHDLAVNPQFTNTATGDFSVGPPMAAVGYPATFP